MRRMLGPAVVAVLLAGSRPAQVLAATGPGFTVEPAIGTITLSIKPGGETPGAVLACTANTVALVSGVAAFSGCRIDLAGSGYRLLATWSEGGTTDSNSFTITGTGGVGTKLGFTSQPAGRP